MARKANGAATAEEEEGGGGEVVQQIAERTLKALLKSQAKLQGDIDEIQESLSSLKTEMGNEVKKAKAKHLDIEMFKIIKKLHKMSDEKLGYHLPNLLYMLDASGITERAQNAPPLQFEQVEEADGNMPQQESVRAH
jgi:hypothetical protein